MFLFHLLAADSENIKSEGNGIAMVHATKGGMEQRKFPLPPLAIQQEIVAKVEAHQQHIEKLKAEIAESEAKIKTVIDRVWGGGETA